MNTKIISIRNNSYKKDITTLHAKLKTISKGFSNILDQLHQINKNQLNKTPGNILYDALIRKDIDIITYKEYTINDNIIKVFTLLLEEIPQARTLIRKYPHMTLENITHHKLSWLIGLSEAGTTRINSVQTSKTTKNLAAEDISSHDQLFQIFRIEIPEGEKAVSVTVEIKQSGHTRTCMHRPIVETH